MHTDLCCTEAGSDCSCIELMDSAVAGYPETPVQLAWGVTPHLLHPELPSYLAPFSFGALTSSCITHRWANLAGASAPARSSAIQGGFLGSSGRGTVGKHLPSLAGFPKKTAAD